MCSRVTQQGRGATVAVTQRGSPGVRPGATTSDGTAGIVWDYRLAIGGEKDRWKWEVPVPKGLCFQRKYAFFKKKLNPFPKYPSLVRVQGSCASRGFLKASLERPAGNFLGQVFGFFFLFFFPFPNFPLLKIFQAFSAEGALALLT